MTDRETTILNGRVKRIRQILGRDLSTPQAGTEEPLPEQDRAYLRSNGEELYWNELEWEKITGEERVAEAFLTELAFPGFLAFIRGLLLEEAMPDSAAAANPRPEVVEDLLRFLAGRVVELGEEMAVSQGEERGQREAELTMTSRLLDLVLYRFHGLGSEEIRIVESVLMPE